jgi:hypothetical protein
VAEISAQNSKMCAAGKIGDLIFSRFASKGSKRGQMFLKSVDYSYKKKLKISAEKYTSSSLSMTFCSCGREKYCVKDRNENL